VLPHIADVVVIIDKMWKISPRVIKINIDKTQPLLLPLSILISNNELDFDLTFSVPNDGTKSHQNRVRIAQEISCSIALEIRHAR